MEAYAQLSAEGYLSARQGSRTRVAAAPSIERPPVPAVALRPRHLYDLHPGLPDLAGFPRDQWARSQRAALRDAPFDALGHGDPRGTVELRNALMGYLGRVRGAAPEPEHTLVCSGFTQGLALVCRALADRGVERIALEDPGWAQHRLIAERSGLEAVPVPVDAWGIDTEVLAGSGTEVVVVTPAHQFPTGAVLGPERRTALLAWAEETDGLIVEDDYDSELRYDRDPIGALQGVAPERVCHLGSVSKRLAPALRLGWVLSPSWLTGALTYEHALSGAGAPVLDQLALADLIGRGELDRHLRRMRAVYRERRSALAALLARVVPAATLSGAAAGLFARLDLPAEVTETAVLDAATARRLAVEGLGAHTAAERSEGPGALVLGYGNLPAPALEAAVELLAVAIADARRSAEGPV